MNRPTGLALKALIIGDVTMIRFQPDGQIVAYRSRGDSSIPRT